MNLEEDECWIRVWGFTTHQKLRKGRYDHFRRTYSLERKDLIESLNAMWVARELCPEAKPVVESLPAALYSNQAERLLEQLSQKTPYSPRLEVPFEERGSLLANDQWRQELYDRAKVIDLGLLLDGHRVTLEGTLMPEADRRTNINFRVYPTGKQTFLPPNVQLIVLDESGTIFMETKSRRADNWIQLGFRGSHGDCFSVKVALGDASVTEHFVIPVDQFLQAFSNG